MAEKERPAVRRKGDGIDLSVALEGDSGPGGLAGPPSDDGVVLLALAHRRPGGGLAVAREDQRLIARAILGDLGLGARQAAGIDIEVLGAADIAQEEVTVGGARLGGRGADRLVVEGNLLASAAGEGHAVQLGGGAKPGRDQHRAVRQPILESGAADVLPAPEGFLQRGRNRRDVLQDQRAHFPARHRRRLRRRADGHERDARQEGQYGSHLAPFLREGSRSGSTADAATHQASSARAAAGRATLLPRACAASRAPRTNRARTSPARAPRPRP